MAEYARARHPRAGGVGAAAGGGAAGVSGAVRLLDMYSFMNSKGACNSGRTGSAAFTRRQLSKSRVQACESCCDRRRSRTVARFRAVAPLRRAAHSAASLLYKPSLPPFSACSANGARCDILRPQLSSLRSS